MRSGLRTVQSELAESGSLGLAALGSGFAQRLGFSHSPGLIDRVKFGLAWKFGWSRGGGGILIIPSAAAILTCKAQYFGNPHAKHRIHARERPITKASMPKP